jgi:hypothetical protein
MIWRRCEIAARSEDGMGRERGVDSGALHLVGGSACLTRVPAR